MTSRLVLLLLGLTTLLATNAGAQPRRALLIGINDYSASRLGMRPRHVPPSSRDWPNLSGAVNDVNAIAKLLEQSYGFDRAAITTLTDQSATRAAILGALEQHLVRPAAKGDVILFYYAGHGSQVLNSLSAELDKMDESLVPADSRIGAADIRDKELRPLFNRILERGARLTVLFDNCHSGSGARGSSNWPQARGIRAEMRDVTDRASGPAPEDRGALVISAAQDFDTAWETRDDEGNVHGAFSWAWVRAMRDASPGESASETFLRAQARLRSETPYQEPVLAGNEAARSSPFLGNRATQQPLRIAVERVQRDGTVRLQGGWANGLAVGTQLRAADNSLLTVTSIHGLGRSEARPETGRAVPPAIRSGALLGVTRRAAPSLRVGVPRIEGTVKSLTAFARALHKAATRRGVQWIIDPTDVKPTHVLRRAGDAWELIQKNRAITRATTNSAVIAAIANLPSGSLLFVQLPSVGAFDGFEIGDKADYVLAGRYVDGRISHAWLKCSAAPGLPPRSAWVYKETELRRNLQRLQRAFAWHSIESPPASRAAYRLGIVRNGDTHSLVLRAAASPPPPRVQQRYYYAFAIDSEGRGVLLFPRRGSVENRFPLASSSPPAQISLGDASAFRTGPPYGRDTLFLLSSDEPLPNPWILEFDGVAAPALPPIGAPSASWSIEKVVLESKK